MTRPKRNIPTPNYTEEKVDTQGAFGKAASQSKSNPRKRRARTHSEQSPKKRQTRTKAPQPQASGSLSDDEVEPEAKKEPAPESSPVSAAHSDGAPGPALAAPAVSSPTPAPDEDPAPAEDVASGQQQMEARLPLNLLELPGEMRNMIYLGRGPVWRPIPCMNAPLVIPDPALGPARAAYRTYLTPEFARLNRQTRAEAEGAGIEADRSVDASLSIHWGSIHRLPYLLHMIRESAMLEGQWRRLHHGYLRGAPRNVRVEHIEARSDVTVQVPAYSFLEAPEDWDFMLQRYEYGYDMRTPRAHQPMTEHNVLLDRETTREELRQLSLFLRTTLSRLFQCDNTDGNSNKHNVIWDNHNTELGRNRLEVRILMPYLDHLGRVTQPWGDHRVLLPQQILRILRQIFDTVESDQLTVTFTLMPQPNERRWQGFITTVQSATEYQNEVASQDRHQPHEVGAFRIDQEELQDGEREFIVPDDEAVRAPPWG
ncbi:hypothetical protein T440DRAFT_552076 [Plenodomus tracheiphilus IPT5]|uniref:Uncharacterized protein n=1 Tax=Plenodomus tracheiphilus IPT5 TaxID=1408161 RepID=A0A6A7BI90_9PLEO|nr:hypothetical protein T440DRAFT_552076 [Plenodomus tracheiphilus IPT5]